MPKHFSAATSQPLAGEHKDPSAVHACRRRTPAARLSGTSMIVATERDRERRRQPKIGGLAVRMVRLLHGCLRRWLMEKGGDVGCSGFVAEPRLSFTAV